MSFSSFIKPKCYTVTVKAGSTYQDNRLAFPGVAVFTQVSNPSGSAIKVQLNDDAEAEFGLEAGDTQSFNQGDMHLTSVAFSNPGSSDTTIKVLAGVVQ